jgi:hypothetical protein
MEVGNSTSVQGFGFALSIGPNSYFKLKTAAKPSPETSFFILPFKDG